MDCTEQYIVAISMARWKVQIYRGATVGVAAWTRRKQKHTTAGIVRVGSAAQAGAVVSARNSLALFAGRKEQVQKHRKERASGNHRGRILGVWCFQDSKTPFITIYPV